jgi:Ca2+-binding EF-hand superfamily protein
MTSITSSTLNVQSPSSTQGTSGAHGHGRHKPDFSKLDTDGSGGLSLSEFQTMIQNGPARAGTGSAATDASSTSGTSSTSSTSDTSGIDALFTKLDTDGDGSISQTELEAGRPKGDGAGSDSNNGLSQMGLSTSDFAQMMGTQSQGMQGPPPPPPAGENSGGFASVDTDGDGSISKAEFGIGTTTTTTSITTTSADGSSSSSISASTTSSTSENDELGKLFDAIDSDGSGSLSSSEVSDFRQKMQDIFSSLSQQMQQYGHQQYQWFSQDGSSSSSTNAISYDA